MNGIVFHGHEREIYYLGQKVRVNLLAALALGQVVQAGSGSHLYAQVPWVHPRCRQHELYVENINKIEQIIEKNKSFHPWSISCMELSENCGDSRSSLDHKIVSRCSKSPYGVCSQNVIDRGDTFLYH